MKKIRRILEAKWLVMLVWLAGGLGGICFSRRSGEANTRKHHAAYLANCSGNLQY